MKLAYLIQAHKSSKQINLLINTILQEKYLESIYFFIHLDKKVPYLQDEITKRKNVIILPEELRVNVRWGQISQVEATLNLIKYAATYDIFDYFWLCSGQDFPIKPIDQIIEKLQNNLSVNYVNLFASKNNGLDHGTNYDKRNEIIFYNWMIGQKFWQRVIKRIYVEFTGGYQRTFRVFMRKNTAKLKFYFGSTWWCINYKTMSWILEYLREHRNFFQYYKHCVCPDESFFQTLIMNSPYSEEQQDYLHYVDWSENNSSPKLLSISDYDALMNSSKLMARKFDMEKDHMIIDMIMREINK